MSQTPASRLARSQGYFRCVHVLGLTICVCLCSPLRIISGRLVLGRGSEEQDRCLRSVGKRRGRKGKRRRGQKGVGTANFHIEIGRVSDSQGPLEVFGDFAPRKQDRPRESDPRKSGISVWKNGHVFHTSAAAGARASVHAPTALVGPRERCKPVSPETATIGSRSQLSESQISSLQSGGLKSQSRGLCNLNVPCKSLESRGAGPIFPNWLLRKLASLSKPPYFASHSPSISKQGKLNSACGSHAKDE